YIGAVEREVADVSRPPPVVDLPAEVPDPLRRRIHEAQVPDLELLDLVPLEPAEERSDATPRAVLLALRRPLLAPALDGLVTSPIPEIGSETPFQLVGDIAHAGRDVRARPRAAPDLIRPRPRQEPVRKQVALRHGVVLERPGHAMVVRHD